MIDLPSCKRERFPLRAVVSIACAILLSGCSTALPSLIDTEPTGSITPRASPLSAAYGPSDWRIAEPVLAASLRAPDSAELATWSNADTGKSGDFKPLAETFARDGRTCRSFVARLVEAKVARRLQAVGCPDDDGEVAIFEATPWTGL